MTIAHDIATGRPDGDVATDPHPYRGEEAAPPEGAIGETIREAEVAIANRTILHDVSGIGPGEEDAPVLTYLQEQAALGAFDALWQVAAGHARADKQETVRDAYGLLAAMFRTSALGVRTHWPEAVWGTLAGRLIYVAFHAAYGDHDPDLDVPNGLMLGKDVRRLTGLGLPRIGQAQRYGILDYIENPWVTHQKQRRRRITPDFLQDFLENHPPSGGLDPDTLEEVREMARLRAARRRGDQAEG